MNVSEKRTGGILGQQARLAHLNHGDWEVPMQVPLQISFRDMEPSAAVEDRIRERAAKLDRYYERIMGCRVVVEAPHRRHHQGKLYHVRVDLTVPQGELVVSREPVNHHAHEDVYVAIRDAFDAAQRRLADYARRQRGDIKVREAPPVVRVSKLFAAEGYGFLAAPDGREIYFHKNSVLSDAFDRLQVGSEVQYAEEQGEKGPQASTVRLVGKSHG
jgi:ribosomal subunit interface protein